MDLHTLAQRTGIARDRLRYCIDRKAVPAHEIQTAENVTGRPRQFDDVTALFIVCASLLIDIGLRPLKIREWLDAVVECGPAYQAIKTLVEQRLQGTLYFSGEHFGVAVPILDYDSHWRKISDPNGAFVFLSPDAQIVLDLAAIQFRMLATDNK